MKTSTDRKYNTVNFIESYKALSRYNVFPFFGTLLGLVRDRDIIEGDDDIDFYANYIFRDEINETLLKSGFQIESQYSVLDSRYFTQASRVIDGIETFVDVYFYEKYEELDFIIDRWNFMGHVDIPECWMKIKKSLLFPLRKQTFLGIDVLVPNKPRKCCKLLYGGDWKIKKSKVLGDYKTVIHNSLPLILKKGDYLYHLTEAHLLMDAEIKQLKKEAEISSASID